MLEINDVSKIIKNEKGWYLPEFDKSSWKYIFERQNEPREISKFCKKTDICLTAGGNIGFYEKIFSEIFSHVYTFEPDSVNFNCLVLNLLKCDNVYKFQSALGEKNETISLNMSNDNCGGHNLGRVIQSGYIPLIKIDDLNLRDLDLLQIDVEGSEKRVLMGAIQTIKKYKPIICVEAAWENDFSIITKIGYSSVAKLDVNIIFAHSS